MRGHFRILALATTLAAAGCVVAAPPGANPYPPVPPLQAEMVPKPPVSEDPLIWQPGHWDWIGRSYVWDPGQWVPKAGHGENWQSGYWTTSPSGPWVWVPAHWL